MDTPILRCQPVGALRERPETRHVCLDAACLRWPLPDSCFRFWLAPSTYGPESWHNLDAILSDGEGKEQGKR